MGVRPGPRRRDVQSLAAQAPLLAAASMGLAFGPRIAACFGLLVGPAEWWAVVLNDFDEFSLRHVFSLVATSLFFAAGGAVFGWLIALLRRVELEVAERRARDRVADVLHDTVLQTLAAVEQRSVTTDPELAASARRADHELRRFLFGVDDPGSPKTMETLVRDAVDRASSEHDPGRVVDIVVNVVDDGDDARPDGATAVAGAIGESVTNALKHAAASRIVVFVESTDDRGIEGSVHDDGIGFDVDAALADRRHGLSGSITRRMVDAGGGAEIRSRPGEGTDVRVWIR